MQRISLSSPTLSTVKPSSVPKDQSNGSPAAPNVPLNRPLKNTPSNPVTSPSHQLLSDNDENYGIKRFTRQQRNEDTNADTRRTYGMTIHLPADVGNGSSNNNPNSLDNNNNNTPHHRPFPTSGPTPSSSLPYTSASAKFMSDYIRELGGPDIRRRIMTRNKEKQSVNVEKSPNTDGSRKKTRPKSARTIFDDSNQLDITKEMRDRLLSHRQIHNIERLNPLFNPHTSEATTSAYYNPDAYEFWWDEDKNEENGGDDKEGFEELFLSQKRFGAAAGSSSVNRSGNSQGNDKDGNRDGGSDGDGGDGDSEDGDNENGDGDDSNDPFSSSYHTPYDPSSMWLTNSSLLLSTAKSNNKSASVEADENNDQPLTESIQEILKMNTLSWLRGRGKGKKMATQLDRVRMLRDWFEALDADGSGDISVDELEEPLISIGLVASKQDLEEMIKKFDSSGDGEIDFQEFVKMVMTREEGGGSNAMLKLFEDFSEGKLGNKHLPFSTLVHLYSREKLFMAIMAEDEEKKAEGQKVLKARTQRIEAREFENKLAEQEKERKEQRRRSSMKIALGFTSSQLQKTVDLVLGEDTKLSPDVLRERRNSMTMMARRNSVSRVNDIMLQGGDEMLNFLQGAERRQRMTSHTSQASQASHKSTTNEQVVSPKDGPKRRGRISSNVSAMSAVSGISAISGTGDVSPKDKSNI